MTAGPRDGAWSLALGGLLALALALGIGRFVYTPILPRMAEGLGWSPAQGGLVASVNLAGYLAGAIATATPWWRFPRRATLLAALAACVVTTVALGAASSLPAFLVLRLVGGFASAVVFVIAAAIVLDGLAAAGRPGLAALHFAGVGTGIVVSAALVALLGAAGFGWRALWYACGILCAGAALAVWRLVPVTTAAPVALPGAGPAGSGGALARLAVAYGLFGFGYVVTATFLVSIVRADVALRPVEPWVWIAFGAAAAPSVALWLAVERRLGLRAAFALAALAEAAGVALSVTGEGAPGVLAASILNGGTFMGLTALGLIGARRLARGDPRRALGLMSTAFGIGQTVGPVLAGWIAERTGSYLAPSMAAAMALALAAVLAASVGRGAEVALSATAGAR